MNLGFKLIFLVGLTTILVIGIFVYINSNIQEKQLIEEVTRGVNQFSETVKRSTWHDMLKDQRENVYRIMTTIGDQEGVEKVRIFNKEGKIMFSTDTPEQGKIVDMKAEACYACHAAERPLEKLETLERTRIFSSNHGYRVLGMITPIYNEEACYTALCHAHPEEQKVLGVLDIDMSLAKVDKSIAGARFRLIIFACISMLIISLVIGFSIHKFVTYPVNQLVEEMRRVAMGELDHSINIKSYDEIGYLVNAFNKMTKDLRKAQNQLLRSEKLASVGKLAAAIAHEINNPLGGINTYIRLIMRKLENKATTEEDLKRFSEYLAIMGKETERCGNIVKNLLDFCRPKEPFTRRIDINALIDEVLILTENQITLQKIELDKRMQKLPCIMADLDQLKQAFLNIIINACEAMNGSSTTRNLLISTIYMENDGYVEIEFTDTGMGIPEENFNKIFDPFFTTKEKGTGLGLFLVYGIVNKNGGIIDIKSRVGEGTTVNIKFPAEVKIV